MRKGALRDRGLIAIISAFHTFHRLTDRSYWQFRDRSRLFQNSCNVGRKLL
jgi:hypothetical protein